MRTKTELTFVFTSSHVEDFIREHMEKLTNLPEEDIEVNYDMETEDYIVSVVFPEELSTVYKILEELKKD